MNGILGHDSALKGYTGPGITCDNEMNFCYAPGAGSIAGPVELQSSTETPVPNMEDDLGS